MSCWAREGAPQTLREFESRFSTEDACVDYLAQMRRPSGFVCPACDGRKAWQTDRQLFHCAACGHQGSITAGTIFQGTRKPLQIWFRATWWVISQKNGASAKGLRQNQGLGSDQTAWAWLHKLRRVMVRPGRDQLSGFVEVDETYVGGPEKRSGRGAQTKIRIDIAVEKRGRARGCTRMAVVREATRDELCGFIECCVATGSSVPTDGWQSDRTLKRRGDTHDS